MIKGTVSGDREILVPLDVIADDGSQRSLEAIVDTGFNGFLTLSAQVLRTEGAAWAGTRRATLGDGNIVEMDVFRVTVRWYDKDREVLALSADSKPLIGLSMLWGSYVAFDAQDGGTLTMTMIP